MALGNLPLSNTKTREQLGFEYCRNALNTLTPQAKALLKEKKPYKPGEEGRLIAEFSRLEKVRELRAAHPDIFDMVSQDFMEIKDIEPTLKKCLKQSLNTVEFYEVKLLLILLEDLYLLQQKLPELPGEYRVQNLSSALDILDPSKERIATFYLYDSFSEKLASLRVKKREYEVEARKVQKALREELRREHGIMLTPKFDITASKGDQALIAKLDAIPALTRAEEDYMSVRFELIPNSETDEINKKADELAIEIEDEEMRVCEMLTEKISAYVDNILDSCSCAAEFDIAIAKAAFADEYDCVRPEISEEHIIEFEDGRHPEVLKTLEKRGAKYCPVSISLRDGVSLITGANMGGKTISLKLTGLIAMLAQNAFFVPAKRAKIGLSSHMQILIGDSQSVERGLSSFGSEMEELKEILDKSTALSLVLIDEIASGTNPTEGLALTKSLAEYLKKRPIISLITTHFEGATDEEGILNLQVRGLAGVDFRLLERELKYANRRQRIEVIGKYMDYRLYRVDKNTEVPRDALNIARMLGLPDEIIEGAKKFI